MARGGKKKDSGGTTAAAAAAAAPNPEAEERNRLKDLAFAKRILAQNPPKVGPSTALGPSKILIKHHSKDIILKKSQRKNKFLFSFPGLLAPLSGGKIGDLKDLGTKNPILYLDFPQGQMKLFGTVTFPKNRYLTMQFSRGGKNVTCDDYFENMVVFSDAWWIGTKDENPQELHLPFPQEMKPLEKQVEYDFKGGIGVKCDRRQTSGKSSMKCMERQSPEPDLANDLTDSPSDLKEMVVTPIRHSSRTSRKTFNFAEESSEEDLTGDGDKVLEEPDDIVGIRIGDTKNESFTPVNFEVENQYPAKEPTSGKNKRGRKSNDDSSRKPKSLVQSTLSSLFKKAEEKASKSAHVGDKVELQEAGTGKSVMKEQKKNLKRPELVNSDTVDQKKSKGKGPGMSSSRKGKSDSVSTSQSSDHIDSSQVDDDDIEEFSSSSQEDMNESDEDEDWTS